MSANWCHGECPRKGLKRNTIRLPAFCMFIVYCISFFFFFFWSSWLTLALIGVAQGRQDRRQVGSSLYNCTAAVCVDLRDCSRERCENVWVVWRWQTDGGDGVKRGWDDRCDDKFRVGLCVQAPTPPGYFVALLCECACECVQLCDNSGLSLPPCAADYWCYMACGGAPGARLTPARLPSSGLKPVYGLQDSLPHLGGTRQTTYFHVL